MRMMMRMMRIMYGVGGLAPSGGQRDYMLCRHTAQSPSARAQTRAGGH